MGNKTLPCNQNQKHRISTGRFYFGSHPLSWYKVFVFFKPILSIFKVEASCNAFSLVQKEIYSKRCLDNTADADKINGIHHYGEGQDHG